MLLCPRMGVPVVGDSVPIVIESPWGQTLWTMEPVCIPKASISHPFIQWVREEDRGSEDSIAVSCRSVRCAVETAWCYENLMWKISCRRCIFNGDHTDAGIITGALPLTSRNVSCTAPKQLCTSRLNLVGVWRLKLLQVFQLLAKKKKSSICLLKHHFWAPTACGKHRRIHKCSITLRLLLSPFFLLCYSHERKWDWPFGALLPWSAVKPSLFPLVIDIWRHWWDKLWRLWKTNMADRCE